MSWISPSGRVRTVYSAPAGPFSSVKVVDPAMSVASQLPSRRRLISPVPASNTSWAVPTVSMTMHPPSVGVGSVGPAVQFASWRTPFGRVRTVYSAPPGALTSVNWVEPAIRLASQAPLRRMLIRLVLPSKVISARPCSSTTEHSVIWAKLGVAASAGNTSTAATKLTTNQTEFRRRELLRVMGQTLLAEPTQSSTRRVE